MHNTQTVKVNDEALKRAYDNIALSGNWIPLFLKIYVHLRLTIPDVV
jgi:hypothetical protein